MPFSRHTRRGHRPALAAPVPQLMPATLAPEPTVAQPDDGADPLTREARILWERARAPARTDSPDPVDDVVNTGTPEALQLQVSTPCLHHHDSQPTVAIVPG